MENSNKRAEMSELVRWMHAYKVKRFAVDGVEFEVELDPELGSGDADDEDDV